MAFFDKLNDLAKNIGDKTGDAIETGRLNSKIAADKKEIAALMQKAGEYYYEKYKNGEVPPEEIKDYFAAADEKYIQILENQSEISKLRTADEPGRAAGSESQSVPETSAAMETQDAPGKIACPGCGAMHDAGTRFCGECGSRME
jgi:hypothetical protein